MQQSCEKKEVERWGVAFPCRGHKQAARVLSVDCRVQSGSCGDCAEMWCKLKLAGRTSLLQLDPVQQVAHWQVQTGFHHTNPKPRPFTDQGRTMWPASTVSLPKFRMSYENKLTGGRGVPLTLLCGMCDSLAQFFFSQSHACVFV